jgi:predicted TIM-barrel fold metal-dependent hydrolase
MAALDPSTQLLGYDLRGEQAESWCRLYNECVKVFVEKHPDRFTAMAAVPIQEPERAGRVLEHAITELGFRGAYIPPTLTIVITTAKISIRSGPKRRS